MTTSEEMPEFVLIERIRAGETSVYDQLVLRHREAVFRLAYLISGSADDAEDITQETFIRALSQLHRFDTERPLRPWLLQITRNLARNQLRAWGRYRQMLKRLVSAYRYPETDTGAITHAQQQAQMLHSAVRQLSVEHQDVIYTRYFLELPVDESAQILGIPEGTVKSRSYRALKQLKDLIESQYPQLKEEFDHG